MGYESKFYVIEKTTHLSAGRYWGKVIVMINMCEIGNENTWGVVANSEDTQCFIYDDIGNNQIITDEYGDNLKEIEIKDMITALKKNIKKDSYRRFPVFLALLESFNNDKWNNLKILHYGY